MLDLSPAVHLGREDSVHQGDITSPGLPNDHFSYVWKDEGHLTACFLRCSELKSILRERQQLDGCSSDVAPESPEHRLVYFLWVSKARRTALDCIGAGVLAGGVRRGGS